MDQKRSKNKGRKEGTSPGGASPSAVEEEKPFLFDPSLPLENERHERFVLELLAYKSQTQAYLRAYPNSSYDSARNSASDLIANHCVKERLEYLREEQKTRCKMTADEVLFGLTLAARFDPADLYRSDGSMIPIHELPPEVRQCIEKVEFEEIYMGEGADRKVIGRTGKVQAMSKKAAYELLGKAHKLFTDKVIHEHKFSLEDILAGDTSEVANEN